MAKAKKTESSKTEASSAPQKSPAKKAAPKAAAKAAPAAAAGGLPSINTSLAAENAAKLLVAGVNKKAGTAKPNPESSMFKQLKSGLNKPAGMGNLLDKTHGPTSGLGNKSGQPFGDNKQVGHNQTFGADVSRASVPRRTSGG